MIKSVLRMAAIGAIGAAFIAGCGGGSKTSSTAANAANSSTTSTTTSQSSTSTRRKRTSTTKSTSTTTSASRTTTTGATASTAPSGGGGISPSNPAASPQAVAACKAQIANSPQVPAESKQELEKLCAEAATGNKDAIRKAAAEVCRDIVKNTLPASQQEAALSRCPKP